MKKIILLVVLITTIAFFFKKDIGNLFAAGNNMEQSQDGKKNAGSKKKGKKGKAQEMASSNIKLVKQWDLPDELLEVSGIAYLDEARFACIQDEEGTIFIYNRDAEKIESKIPFAGAGDYEGITLAGTTAYVVRADGQLFEINNFRSAKPVVNQYKTPLTVAQNIEGLTYDKVNNRLLLAAKDDKPNDGNYRGIYAFDLSQKVLAAQPVYKINLDDEVMSKGNKKDKNIRPSAIGIHPLSQEIIITDGPGSRLLVVDNEGNMKGLYQLGNDFYKAEGISFSPQGKIFISNEGKKQPGNIIEIEME